MLSLSLFISCTLATTVAVVIASHDSRSIAPSTAVELAVSGVVPRIVTHLRGADPVMQKKALSLLALIAQDPKARESLHDLDFSLLTQFLGTENQKLQTLACSAYISYHHPCYCVSLLIRTCCYCSSLFLSLLYSCHFFF